MGCVLGYCGLSQSCPKGLACGTPSQAWDGLACASQGPSLVTKQGEVWKWSLHSCEDAVRLELCTTSPGAHEDTKLRAEWEGGLWGVNMWGRSLQSEGNKWGGLPWSRDYIRAAREFYPQQWNSPSTQQMEHRELQRLKRRRKFLVPCSWLVAHDSLLETLLLLYPRLTELTFSFIPSPCFRVAGSVMWKISSLS